MCPAITVGGFGQVPVKANGLELGGGHQGQAQRSSSLGSWALDPCLPCGKAGAKTQGEGANTQGGDHSLTVRPRRDLEGGCREARPATGRGRGAGYVTDLGLGRQR